MKALVTGAAGFVGSTLSARLLADGHDVVGIDSLTDYYDINIKRANLSTIAHPKFSFHQVDINTADLGLLLHDVDYIFHQAGQPGVRKSWGEEFIEYTSANIGATQRLLEAARSCKKLKRFVYASSSSIYGDAENYPTTEEATPKPMSPYGVSKLAAEHLCTLYAKNFGVPTVSLRYFTVYGPRQRTDMAFTRFVKAAATNGSIHIYGSGEQVRDFTYVDDIVQANISAAEIDSLPGSVFNVAGGTSISVNGVLALLENLHGAPLNVAYVDKVAGDVTRTGGDTSKIEKAFSWRAKTTLERGLERQLDWAYGNFKRD
ncbi:NAD-dependent epimerase/dehydratase family protein [Arthrobacter sp. M-10]|uniref:NAD-dependent epimerase/dehydratase family protein n=1 Tax=Arthrobacter sp. M-10 TaxID=3233037 RepID=UPI003F92DCF3